MRNVTFAALAPLIASMLLAATAGTLRAEPDFGPAAPPLPPSLVVPPGSRAFGLDGAGQGLMPGLPGEPGIAGPPLVPGRRDAAPVPKAADKPAEKAPPTRGQVLDDLFGRLATAKDPAEAQGIATLIQHVWLRSGSDTADLLMTRALGAMSGERRDIARALLDKIILLRPDWAEAWNRRATLRFLDNDDSGSMADISHVLSLEPRHFGALSGMGFILQRHGMGKQALTALRRALDIYPGDAEIRKVVEQLTPEVEGRDL